MIIIETDKDCHGMWAFSVSAGEKSNLDQYAASCHDYESEYEADMAGLRWLIDAWHVM